MLDMRLIRNHPEYIKKKLATRNVPGKKVDELLHYDNQRRQLIVRDEKLKAERNKVSKQIPQMKKAGKDIKPVIQKMRKVGSEIKGFDKKFDKVHAAEKNVADHLPNLPADDVPVSSTEKGAKEIRRIGEPTHFSFQPKHHWTLGENLGILNFERSAKVSGARFVYYVGEGALLERALYNFFLDQNTSHGYKEILPPYMVNSASMYGTGQFPKFLEKHAGYECEGTDLTMIPTAEVPLINYYRGETLPADQLPIRVTALSPAFRSEAGSAGRDTRGLIRVHQFNKVELAQFTKPNESWHALAEITHEAERLLRLLKIPYHVIRLTSSDMSFTAATTYDLEVWMPGQHCYREISSCSNTRDFQARRSHITYRDQNGKLQYVHTLNGSGLAVGRTVATIMENYQNEDGTIDVPKVLQPYMHGIKKITKDHMF
ncbi:MAG: serine--tRNA ligase [Acetilactobacillus jinshanensis]